MANEKSVFLKCDDHAETAVFTRFNWDLFEEGDKVNFMRGRSGHDQICFGY